jgi:hypothetical protein
MSLIMTKLNERLRVERALLHASLGVVAQQPRWHEVAVADAAPLLEVFKAFDYVGSLELAMNAVEKQNAVLRERVLDLVRL